MKIVLFSLWIVFCAVSYAQPIDARDNLTYPVNPPRDVAPNRKDIPFSIAPESREALAQIMQTRSDLKKALDDGLAENHPTVKFLRAKLEVLHSSMSVSTVTKPKNDGKSEKKEIEELRSELLMMKTEIKKLCDQLIKLKEK